MNTSTHDSLGRGVYVGVCVRCVCEGVWSVHMTTVSHSKSNHLQFIIELTAVLSFKGQLLNVNSRWGSNKSERMLHLLLSFLAIVTVRLCKSMWVWATDTNWCWRWRSMCTVTARRLYRRCQRRCRLCLRLVWWTIIHLNTPTFLHTASRSNNYFQYSQVSAHINAYKRQSQSGMASGTPQSPSKSSVI